MVSREECVTAINKFIKTQQMKELIILLEYLCDIKEVANKEETIKTFISNPIIISTIAPRVIEELEISMKINRIIDRNNTLIVVF